tara:strand:- start:69 stop:806 length:738 start_codon:yes stop_codon:yes gene_type:complete
MNKYYKIFGLEKSAHFEEVTKKYNELSKEFNPANQTDDLKEFFIVEQKKLDEAFEKISSSISKDNPISDNIIDKNNNEDLSAEEKELSTKMIGKKNENISQKNTIRKEKDDKFSNKNRIKNKLFDSKWISRILNRKKIIALFIVLIPILKLFVHYFIYTSYKGSSSSRFYNLKWHTDNVFIEEIWLFVPLSILIFVVFWFFSEKDEANSSVSYLTEQLLKLNELKEKGLLTEEEFNEQKKKLLKQ